jgi:mono/diheme cytochrome c family protein
MRGAFLTKNAALILATLCCVLGVSRVWAQENGSTVTGAALYRTHCAPCHGESGRGDGMVGAALRTPPADLTAIAGKNGGIFPDSMVIEFIDGTRDVLAHGPRAMPVWGLIFQNRETIRKIVDHLRTLQQP